MVQIDLVDDKIFIIVRNNYNIRKLVKEKCHVESTLNFLFL